MIFKLIILILLLNGTQPEDVNKEKLSSPSTLDVLYLVPEEQESIYTLNEKTMLGNDINRGWVLPSEISLTLNLYLYYDGVDERRLNSFFHSTNLIRPNTSLPQAQKLQQKSPHQSAAKALLYMYFTENSEQCVESSNHQPLEIVEKLASNMYRAQLKSITLPYSSKPYYICMQQFDTDDDIHDTMRFFSHQGKDYWISIITTKDFLPLWARIILFTILLSLSGLFSGLNLGLMSLDLSELEILKKIGTPKEQSFASKIYPLRKSGNFLLCTILLGNVLVNSTSTLILGDMLSGIYAALGSTLLIVIFGEIIPQAACSKHGLAVGAYTRYITYFFMFITCPLSFPISLILDKVLGKEIAAVYNREKIRELMKTVKDMNNDEFKMISGALDFNNKKVEEIMTKLDDVFMLDKTERLDFETIAKISQNGYSRIPVYENSRDNIIGLLHVKDFTLLDPDDNMPVEAILQFYSHKIISCDADRPIDEMFEEFSKGETHLAFVQEYVNSVDTDPYLKNIGIVTLEDIIEALVQMEIYDEFDQKEQLEKNEIQSVSTTHEELEFNHRLSVNRAHKETSKNKNSLELKPLTDKSSASSLSVNTKALSRQKSNCKSKSATPHLETQTSHDLSFFIQQQKDSGQRALISPQIRFVMFQYLFTTVKPFTSEFLTKNVLELIFKKLVFKESRRDTKLAPEYLYNYGKGCNHFILILCGEATIEVGKERLEFPAGPFAFFGTNALLCGAETAEDVLNEEPSVSPTPATTPIADDLVKKQTISKQYVPDFSLRVDDRCVYLKLDRELWRKGVVKSQFEKKNNELTDNIDYVAPVEETSELKCNPSKIDFTLNSNSIYKSHGLIKKVEHGSSQYKSGRRHTTAHVLDKVQKTANANLFPSTPTSQKSRKLFLQSPLHESENEQNVKSITSINQLSDDSKDENFNLLPKNPNQSVSIELEKSNQSVLNSNLSLNHCIYFDN